MAARVLTFQRRPKSTRSNSIQMPDTSSFARKAQRLADVDPRAARVLERLVDGMLAVASTSPEVA